MKISDLLIFENDDFIALNKPSGLLSIPDREGTEISLKNLLQEKYGKILTVHHRWLAIKHQKCFYRDDQLGTLFQ